MVETPSNKGSKQRILNRWQARRAGRGPVSAGFLSDPEPRTIGSVARGRHMVSGRFLFGGHLVEDPEGRLWDIVAPDGTFEDDRHGFVWLDDLAALGNAAARTRARAWVAAWISEFGQGAGPGWRPGLTGRRIGRWISHSVMLLDGADDSFGPAFLKSISQQTNFLGRCHGRASPGLPRFEAIAGLLHASLMLDGMQAYLEPAIIALATLCKTEIDSTGSLASRNPQELLDIFSILTWSASAISETGKMVPREQIEAVERIAPILRALRHGDGSLARFHGGGRGEEGRLDQALANAAQRTPRRDSLAMGYARLSGGRTSVIVDAAAPPKGFLSENAHASTLAFELTSGRRPLIVNCGSGAVFGQVWKRAGRATPSHSTLGLAGVSSSTLGQPAWIGDRPVELMSEVPSNVRASLETDDNETALSLSHDGYLRNFGLRHSRHVRLTSDGRRLTGEDELAALNLLGRRRIRVLGKKGAIPFTIRFHLHPDVEAFPAPDSIRMTLKSGEMWSFDAHGPVSITLEPSIYLEKGRLEPRATKQIVLSGALVGYAVHVGWSLAKDDETPDGVRDFTWGALEQDET